MEPHPYGWLSLMPSIAAIVLAIATRRAVISLLAGIYFGALVTTHGNLLQAAIDTCEVHLWPALTEPGKLRIFSFTLSMGAMIGIIHRSGGMQSLVQLVTPLANSRRSGQLATWLTGMIIFFDDYANTLLLGSTFRTLCDRLRISREKLAYVVDSTAAPVAGLALVSTWVAVEIDYVREGLETLGTPGSLKAFDLFFASIPYRFYMLMALLFVPLTAILGRDFGPMLKAERRQSKQDAPPRPSNDGITELPSESAAGGWYYAIVPIVVTLAVVMGLLYRTGLNNVSQDAAAGVTIPLRTILGAADSSLALQYGALAGILMAAFMTRISGLLNRSQVSQAAAQGALTVLPAIAILWTASALSRLTSDKSVDGAPSTQAYEYRDHRLYTGEYLKQIVAPSTTSPSADRPSDELSVRTLPTVVFLLASVVAFCTGTSWGTMGILMPMVVTLAHALLSQGGREVLPSDPILLASIGGVLAGAVFGDHCSPISDTTVLSSQSSGCDHIAHVRTQLPYAVVVAIVAVVLGTLPVGWGVSVWILLPLQLFAMIGVLYVLGERV